MLSFLLKHEDSINDVNTANIFNLINCGTEENKLKYTLKGIFTITATTEENEVVATHIMKSDDVIGSKILSILDNITRESGLGSNESMSEIDDLIHSMEGYFYDVLDSEKQRFWRQLRPRINTNEQ